jgi:hypothetical protein
MSVPEMLKIYHLFNHSEDSEIRRLSGCILYEFIGDSKELAKYIYDKILKNAGNNLFDET